MSAVAEWVQPNDPDRYPRPAAVRFVAGDEFLALAMQSFLDASRAIVPPPGQPWIEDGLYVWAGPEDFTDALLDGLRDRLHLRAIERGHMVPVVAEPGCRGGAPAVMGHGCPALPAVGPAPAISTDHATDAPADPALPGPQMQELPVAGPSSPADIISPKEAQL